MTDVDLRATTTPDERRTARAAARLRTMIFALLIAASSTGCGSGEDVSKQLDTLSSWTATAQLAVAEHRAGAITTTYASQLDAAARQALAETRQSLAHSAHDATESRRASAALDSLERAIHLLDAETRR